MKNVIDRISGIRNCLQDELSKLIFDNRLLYSLTGEIEYIDRIILALPQKKELDKLIEKCKTYGDKLVIYGAGNDLLMLSRLYKDFPIKNLCDKSKQKQLEGWRGIPVMSPGELVQKKDEFYVAVNASAFHKEIVQFLLDSGFKEERIIDLGIILDSLYCAQYFGEDFISPEEGEVFIDGGCFDCSTDKAFIKWCQGKYRKIYAFEPDDENYKKCLVKCKEENIADIEIYNKGLWDCETELSFASDGSAGSRIGENGENIIKIATTVIDNVVDGKVSFIKLDVEGAELKALQGAAQTIRANHPKLAICIYHKPEDVVEILEYILSLYDGYKLYIRHYRMNPCETVVYGVC